MSDQEEDESEDEPQWRVQANTAGTLVFVISSITLLCLVIFSVVFDRDESMITRSAEGILTVAGLGIILSFLLSIRNAVVITLTLLVVAALVIPSRDLIRFALISTGSDRSLEEFYGRAGISANITSRIDAVSLEILTAVEKELHGESLGFTLSERDRLATIIGDVVQRDRTQTLFERLNARGVLELLRGIGNGESNDLIYRYRDEDRLLEDLRYLRYEGLISITYEDLDSIEITPLGVSVVQVSTATETEILQLPNLFGVSRFVPDCSAIEQERLGDAQIVDMDELMATALSFDDLNNDQPELVRLRVLPGFVGTYLFDFLADGEVGTGLDPMLTLYRIGETGAAPTRADTCRLIESDDDGGLRLNARVETELTAGWYLLRLGAFASTSGPGTLTAQRVN